jgi:hypothetical protein
MTIDNGRNYLVSAKRPVSADRWAVCGLCSTEKEKSRGGKWATPLGLQHYVASHYCGQFKISYRVPVPFLGLGPDRGQSLCQPHGLVLCYPDPGMHCFCSWRCICPSLFSISGPGSGGLFHLLAAFGSPPFLYH